jgi:glutamate synthase (NADPH/NADH) large chain
VALGCKYLRICHLNNCATGVATQNNVLRSEYFIGLPEMVINFFRFIAEEVRVLLAELGVAKLEDLIGRVELLELKAGETRRQQQLDLAPIISDAGLAQDVPRFCTDLRNHPFDQASLSKQMLKETLPAIEGNCPARLPGAMATKGCAMRRSIFCCVARLARVLARGMLRA